MCGWTRTASCPRTRAGWSPPSSSSSSAATSNTTSPPALEEKLDLVSAGELDWKALLRDFWRDFHAAVGEIGELRISQVLDALNEALGPHIFPDKGDGTDPRACPTCGDGPAVAEDRPLRRLHRLLQLSGMPLHPPDRRAGRRGGGGRARRPRTGRRSGHRPGRLAEGRPLRPLCRAGRRRQAQARQPAQGLAAGERWTWTRRCGCCACRARSAPHPEDGKHDPGRHRPLRPLRPARRHLRQPRRAPTRCSRSA